MVVPNVYFSASSGGSVEGNVAEEREILDALNRWVNASLIHKHYHNLKQPEL